LTRPKFYQKIFSLPLASAQDSDEFDEPLSKKEAGNLFEELKRLVPTN